MADWFGAEKQHKRELIQEKNNLTFKREQLPRIINNLQHGAGLAEQVGDEVTRKHLARARQILMEVSG